MKKTKKQKKVGKKLLQDFFNKPEKHILKTTNKEISELMKKLSYFSRYAKGIIDFQLNHHTKKTISPEDNIKIDKEVNFIINEINRLSLLIKVKNDTIESKMLKNYNNEASNQ